MYHIIFILCLYCMYTTEMLKMSYWYVFIFFIGMPLNSDLPMPLKYYLPRKHKIVLF